MPFGANELTSHPDGRFLIAATGEHVVRVWQISPDAEPVSRGGSVAQATMRGLEPDRRIRNVGDSIVGLAADAGIAFSDSPGAGGRKLVRLFDPATGRPLGRPAPHAPGWRVRQSRIQSRRSMVRHGEPSARSYGRRGPALGRDRGPAPLAAHAAYQLRVGRWPSSPTARSWPRAISADRSGSGIPRQAGRSAGRFLRARS